MSAVAVGVLVLIGCLGLAAADDGWPSSCGEGYQETVARFRNLKVRPLE